MVRSTRSALARYSSCGAFMSFIRLLVTIMTSAASGQMSFRQRYIMRRRLTSGF